MSKLTGIFRRTECACAACRSCCREQPGSLAPGDLERIAVYLGTSIEEAKKSFCASPGAIVADSHTGRQWRIGTIVPKTTDDRGRCIFLSPDERCTIHPVAPFGCAYFDTHMPHTEGRAALHLREIATDSDYALLRASLDYATTYRGKKL